ncbi:MAG: hypothetical protein ACYTGE_02785 [Planctomycetota bacterium]|jgi:MYXO-CTERM domain-containing protein
MQGRHIALATLAVLGLAPAATASIMTLDLSTHSSDMTPAEDLNATVDFSVVGLTLTISITNDTMMTGEFNINEFYFNGPDGMVLTPDLPNFWDFYVPDMSNPTKADGFGTFDFAVKDGQGENHPSVILPGETLDFSFTMSFAANVKDFTTACSVPDVGDYCAALIAAKFVSGPGDDSAYGATVPTPGVLALMAMAGLVAARPKRRRD